MNKNLYEKQELEELIKEDYFVRNENPHYLKHDNKISIYSLINNELFEDCEIEPKLFDCSMEEAEEMFIKNYFVNIYSQRGNE